MSKHDPALNAADIYIPPNVRDALFMLNAPEALDDVAKTYRASLLRHRGLVDDSATLCAL